MGAAVISEKTSGQFRIVSVNTYLIINGQYSQNFTAFMKPMQNKICG